MLRMRNAKLDSVSSFTFRTLTSAQSRIVPSILRNSPGRRPETVTIRRFPTLADFRSGAELRVYPGFGRRSGLRIRTGNLACIDVALLKVAYRDLRVSLDALVRGFLIAFPTKIRCLRRTGHLNRSEP